MYQRNQSKMNASIKFGNISISGNPALKHLTFPFS